MTKPTTPMTVIKPIQFTESAYSRASQATAYDEDGDLYIAADDVLRSGYDPETHNYIGSIIEATGVNYIDSDITDSGLWDLGSYSPISSTEILPDGTTGTAHGVSGNGYAVYAMKPDQDITPGDYVFSVYVRPSPYGLISIEFDGSGGISEFDAGGSVLTSNPGFGTNCQVVGNGWSRISAAGTISGGEVLLRVSGSASALETYGYVLMCNMQLEPITPNKLPTSYMVDPDGDGVTFRAADIAASAPPYVIETNIPENDYDEWSNIDTYVKDEYVMISGLHRNYQALGAVSADKYPPDFPVLWVDAGATNAWRMFDMSSGADNQSSFEELIRTTVNPGHIADAVVLLNCYGNFARVTVKDGATIIYQREQSLRSRPSGPSWYSWHFGERYRVKDLVFLDLPPKRGVTITIEIVASFSIDAKIGKAIIGRKNRIGFSEYGSSAGIQSFSTKKTDIFGNTRIVVRRFVGKMDLRVVIDKAKEDFTHRKFAELRDIPCVYIGHEKYKCLLVFGFFNDFAVLFSSAASSYCNTTLTGI